MTPQEQRDSHLAELARQAGIEGTRPNVLGAAGAQPFFEPLASMTDAQLRQAMARKPLAMPGVQSGSDLEKKSKSAWDIVSRLWPTMAAKVPRIRFMTETESGKHPHASAALQVSTGELVLPRDGGELRPEVLWHELVHLEQRERGVIQSAPMRDDAGLTEHGRLMESEAHQRGNMQAEDLIARTFDPKINAPDFSLHRGTEPQGTPRKGGQQTGESTSIPVGESAQSSQGGSVPVAQSAQGNYDKRDAEVGKHIAGMKQERFHREKYRADFKAGFSRAAGNMIGGFLGRTVRRARGGINLPESLRSPLLEAMGGVPMFGEGMDASVSGGSGGGGDSSGDMNAKLDKIIEMLSQMGRGGGGSATGPQPDSSFMSGDVPQQSSVRQVGKMALEAAATAATGGAASSSDSMWEMAAKAMMRALIVAAV